MLAGSLTVAECRVKRWSTGEEGWSLICVTLSCTSHVTTAQQHTWRRLYHSIPECILLSTVLLASTCDTQGWRRVSEWNVRLCIWQCPSTLHFLMNSFLTIFYSHPSPTCNLRIYIYASLHSLTITVTFTLTFTLSLTHLHTFTLILPYHLHTFTLTLPHHLHTHSVLNFTLTLPHSPSHSHPPSIPVDFLIFLFRGATPMSPEAGTRDCFISIATRFELFNSSGEEHRAHTSHLERLCPIEILSPVLQKD